MTRRANQIKGKNKRAVTEQDRIDDPKNPKMQSKEDQLKTKKNISEAKKRQKYNKLKKRAQSDTENFGHYDDSLKDKKKLKGALSE